MGEKFELNHVLVGNLLSGADSFGQTFNTETGPTHSGIEGR